MNETSTKTLNVNLKKYAMKETDVATFIDVDDMMFYHAIRPDLDLLQKKPQETTIQHILNFSKRSR